MNKDELISLAKEVAPLMAEILKIMERAGYKDVLLYPSCTGDKVLKLDDDTDIIVDVNGTIKLQTTEILEDSEDVVC